jgi:serine/threonine protein kinase
MESAPHPHIGRELGNYVVLSLLGEGGMGAAIADGLHAAHQKGIIHRDLKPDNVFLTSAGEVKILDGMARETSTLRTSSIIVFRKSRSRRR